MVEILHSALPDDLEAGKPLPGTRPLTTQNWLRVDEAYAAQMAYRRQLIAERRADVLAMPKAAVALAEELMDEILPLLPALGFSITHRHIYCPDGMAIDREADGPLAVLGQVLQEDLCLLEKRGAEHVLAAAVLCFPASWTLAEKMGRPLTGIHAPVASYTVDVARRVQRLFDGVRVDQPIWRNNMLGYDDPDLFQPRRESDPSRDAMHRSAVALYKRAERQTILRLPRSKAVVFAIHSYVVRSKAHPLG